MENLIVELNRPNKSVSWGFSIQGGKDFGCPLSVLRITPNSISEKMEMRVQDLILKLNDIPTDTLTHQQAILQIQNLYVKIELGRHFKKDSDLPPPPPIDITSFNNHCRLSSSISDLPPPPPLELNNSNKTPVYYPPPPPPVIAPINNYVGHTTKAYEPIKSNQQIGSQNITKGNQKAPEISLKTGNVDLLNQRMSENQKKEPMPSLGHFLQNQNKDQNRDNRDLIIQRPDFDRNVAICFVCKDHIKDSYIEANNKTYCSIHFCCSICNKPIKDTQYMETKEGTLYCISDFEKNVAPRCARCFESIVKQQVMAMGKCWHPHCFVCNHCQKPIPHGNFHVKEENDKMMLYCEKDYKEFYEIKCFGCKLVIDSDDKYLLVGGNNYHVECFKR